MASTSFTDNSTVVQSSWLNDVNTVTYTVFGDGSSYTGNFRISATKLLYLDGGGDTYLDEVSANVLRATTGGTEAWRTTSAHFFKASNSGSYDDSTGAYHELRSDTSGTYAVTVSHTHASAPFGIQILFSGSAPNGTSNFFWQAQDTGATRGEFRSNGGLANIQANNVNLSDVKVKTEVEPISVSAPLTVTNSENGASLWDKHKQIGWCKFKYRDQTHDDYNYGYLAQDIQNLFPELVDKWTEESGLLAVYSEDLKNIAGAVLSEAQARIEALESRLAAAGIA